MDEIPIEDNYCLLCKKTDITFVNLYYKEDSFSARQNLTELFGGMIDEYLRNVEVVCFSCINYLQFASDLKRTIHEAIVDNFISLQTSGQPGSRSLKIPNSWIGDINGFTMDHLSESLSPDDLLIVTGSIPYNERCENPDTCLNHCGCVTPGLDKEVQGMMFRSRHRKKGVISGQEGKAVKVEATQFILVLPVVIPSIVEYVQDGDDYFELEDLSHSESSANGMAMKTRFACEMRDKLISEYQQLIYECPYRTCDVTMYTLENITEHRVEIHNDMAMFLCEQCKFYYLSQDDLEKHRDSHFKKFMAYCIYCSEEYTNKRLYEEHLNEHLIYSFPCFYCDKFFLGKQQCENHVKKQHPGMNSKIKRNKPQSILDRIDKKPTNNEHTRTVNESPEFVVKVLCQHGQPEEPRLPADDLSETDMSLDNSLLMENDIIFS